MKTQKLVGNRRPVAKSIPKEVRNWLSQNGRLGGLATKKVRQSAARKAA